MAGNSVIAGHFDSKTGPAIFWRLRELRPGDEIFVSSDDGIERRFVVQATENYRFDNAPLERIFGTTSDAGLNLITCGGTFDRRSSNYDQRLVVYTTLG
jgi:sortase (surface protein transpeptidase)